MSIKSPEIAPKAQVGSNKLPVILIVFVVIYALSTFLTARVIINSPNQFFFFEDGTIFFEAGAKGLLGTNPYQPFGIGTSFFYPPVALLIFAPLSQLPAAFSTVLWLILDLGAYLLSLFIFNLILKPKLSRMVRLLGFVVALLYMPLFESLYAGQINTWILLGFALFTLGYYDKKYAWLGDAALALVILLKVTPLMLVAFPFFQRDWRRCGRIAISLLVLVGLSILFFGFKPWLDFIEVAPQVFAGFPFGWNQSIAAFFELAHLALIGKAIDFLFILAWLYICFRYRSINSPKEIGLLLSFGIITLTISSTIVWYHHLIFLVVPFCYLIYFCWSDRRLRTLRLPSALALFLTELNWVIQFNFYIACILSIVGYLILYGCLLAAIRRKKLLNSQQP